MSFNNISLQPGPILAAFLASPDALGIRLLRRDCFEASREAANQLENGIESPQHHLGVCSKLSLAGSFKASTGQTLGS